MSLLVSHLERQTQSSRRLLGIVLAQGGAIRDRDVEGVLARLAELQSELVLRAQLENERDALVRDTAATLGLPVDDVDLEAMLTLEPSADADVARGLSAELKGLATEAARAHGENQVLIRQELSFLDHLVRLLSDTPRGSYSATGFVRTPQVANAVNARA
jgi:hypothetical protein